MLTQKSAFNSLNGFQRPASSRLPSTTDLMFQLWKSAV